MSIAEIIEDDGEREPLPIRVRLASLRDYEEMCTLFDELDEIHRRALPDMFRPFPPPARTREQIAHWLAQPDSTVLVVTTANLERVTPDDVLRMASDYLSPQNLLTVMVGDAAVIRRPVETLGPVELTKAR